MGAVVSNQDIKELRETKALCPGEKQVAEALGKGRIERYHVVDGKEVPGEGPDGKYMWRAPYQASKDGGKVIEMMSPFWRADTERQSRLQARRPQTKLRDESGSVHNVPTVDAEKAERRNGWREGHRYILHRTDWRHARLCEGCGNFPYYCECGGGR